MAPHHKKRREGRHFRMPWRILMVNKERPPRHKNFLGALEKCKINILMTPKFSRFQYLDFLL